MFSWQSCYLGIVKKHLKSQQEDLGDADSITALSTILGVWCELCNLLICCLISLCSFFLLWKYARCVGVCTGSTVNEHVWEFWLHRYVFFVFLNLMEKVARNHEVRRTVLNLLLLAQKHFENVQTVVTLRLSLALNQCLLCFVVNMKMSLCTYILVSAPLVLKVHLEQQVELEELEF